MYLDVGVVLLGWEGRAIWFDTTQPAKNFTLVFEDLSMASQLDIVGRIVTPDDFDICSGLVCDNQ